MGAFVTFVITFCIFTAIPGGYLQNVDNSARTIFEALSTTLQCGKFQALIIAAGQQTQDFFQRTPQITVFAPNDTAFDQMLPYKRDKILNMSPREKENYVKSYTVPSIVQTNVMDESLIMDSLGGPAITRIFFNKRTRRFNEIVSGSAGRTKYYANGALIYTPDVRAQNGIIQMIDRVLEPIISSKIYGYLRQPDQQNPNKSTKFYTEILKYVSGDFYAEAISPLENSERFTMFVPTDEAIDRIPKIKLEELRSQQPTLSRVVRQHAIRDKAVYTSFVYHNEGFTCIYGRAVFRKNINHQVTVSADGVNALVTQGNITLTNGVIHFVDSLLGFVYRTAREQVQEDPELTQFSSTLNRGRKDLQDFLVAPNGVTLFVPLNSAFSALTNVPGVDFFNNQTLIDYVLELHMLEPGTKQEITNVNGDYMSRVETRTQYKGWNVKIYSQGNDTWAEGGYVKTRVIRPDVGVKNGIVHYIDGVFGVPSRDVPGIIFCEDWLIKSSYILSIAGLNDFMRDVRITGAPPPCTYKLQRTEYEYAKPSSTSQTSSIKHRGGCGESGLLCDFTMFVPNGTTVENFARTNDGRALFLDNDRLRHVLKRHMCIGRKIYIDQLGRGLHYFISATGEEVRFNKQTDYYTEVVFGRVTARVIHQDLGATNGVVHIVDNFLFKPDDLIIDISGSSCKSATYSFLLTFSLSIVLWIFT